MKITILYVFIALLIIKLLTTYTDFKFLLLIVLLLGIFVYIYITKNNMTFDIPLFSNITKNKLFEDKKNNLIKFVVNTNLTFNPEIHQKLIKLVKIYKENTSYVFYGQPKNCEYYFDNLLEQKNEIINLANTFIITIPHYENYDFLKKYIFDLHKLIDELFEFVKQICPKFNIPKFIPNNQFTQLHSFQQI